ncbi:MAG: T9SS type A sorting domain-containing protein [Chitinophagaceae bacterium]|nr:T9SS type A sorting domain-containing protein [Chitinophagaceae bacterium]
MKKHLLTLLITAPLFLSAQQTYTWAVASGSWSVAGNWSPQRTAPAINDILEFNATAIVTGLPASETVGKISIYNNATVNFSASAGSAISIGNASVTGPHLAVAAGASLNISGANAILLSIGSGFSAQIDGNLIFSGTAHRLTATTANAIVFSTGAVFTADAGFGGNAFGNIAANENTVIFQSGATYIFKDGGNPFGLAAPNAVTTFSNGSIYRHQVNGTGPSLAGRTYGNVYIESNVNFAGIGSARDCIIQNDLNVLSGFFSFKPNSLGTHNGNFNIYGNIFASGTSYIDIGSNYMPGAVQMLGTNQIVGGGGGSGSISFDNLTVNNASSTLSRPVAVSGTLSLQNGKIITTGSSLLTLTATATIQSCTHNYINLSYTNIGCDLSYVEGPVKKLGLSGSDFVFPVGVNGKLRPAAVRNATGDFTVEFVRGDPYLDLGSTMGAGIHHTSHLEYWNITGTGSANIELSFFDPNSGGVTDMAALRVARFDGLEWVDQGVNSYLGTPGADGSVTSNPVLVFGSFTLAGALGYPNNPLPDNSIIFSASIQNENIFLNWLVSDETAYKYYLVERASGSGVFTPVSPLIFVQTIDNQIYKFIDGNPAEGKNTYRLKLVKWDGTAIYSAITSIDFRGKSTLIVYPNPAREKIFIKIPKSSSISEIVLVHISGSVIKWLTTRNQTTAIVDIHDLANGVYYIKIIQAGSSTIVPIVKY